MLDLDAQKEPHLSVKVGGKVYQVRRPVMAESLKLKSDLNTEGADDVEVTIQFLDSLGLPSNVTATLDGTQLMALSAALQPKKKD